MVVLPEKLREVVKPRPLHVRLPAQVAPEVVGGDTWVAPVSKVPAELSRRRRWHQRVDESESASCIKGTVFGTVSATRHQVLGLPVGGDVESVVIMKWAETWEIASGPLQGTE